MALDSTRNVHIIRTTQPKGGQNWHELDLAAGTFKPIRTPDEVIKAAGKFPRSGLCEESVIYDPQAKVTLLITKPRYDTTSPMDLWAYDAAKDEWSEVKMAGSPPHGMVQWGLLVYDPGHQCCLLLDLLSIQGSPRWGGKVDGLFAFRLKK